MRFVFATRMSARSTTTGMAVPTARMPLTASGGHGHPLGPPTYEAFAPCRHRLQDNGHGHGAGARASGFGSPPSSSSNDDDGDDLDHGHGRWQAGGLPAPDLKRLRRAVWRRRLRSLFPTMPEGFAERIRLVLPHVLLILATAVYTVVGAAVIYRIERPHEQAHIVAHSRAILEAQNGLLKVPIDVGAVAATNVTLQEAVDRLISVSIDAFAEGVRARDIELLKGNLTRSGRWHFQSALFFTVTVLTSIGYGHLCPISTLGRVFCVAYALIGIPLTLITIADMAKFFSDLITDLDVRRRKSCRPPDSDRDPGTNEMVGGLAESSFAAKVFVIGLLLSYMTGSALFFWLAEGRWGFVDSFYFCMITLVTIGFGDLTPDEDAHYLGWILFMFVGLCLTTLAVDMCGSTCIESFHAVGRVNPRALLSAFTQKVYDTGSPHWRNAYEPHDLRAIPYIDEFIKNNVSKLSV